MDLIALLCVAVAHPIGGHRLDHHLRWRVDGEGSEVMFSVDLPHMLRASPAELAAGLVLTHDGRTVPLLLDRAQERDLEGSTRITLHLRAEHPSGELVLTDGNLQEAAATIVRRIELHRDLDLVEPPPAPLPHTYAARTLRLHTTPAPWYRRLERRLLHASPWRSPSEPATTEPWPGQILAAAGAMFAAVLTLIRLGRGARRAPPPPP